MGVYFFTYDFMMRVLNKDIDSPALKTALLAGGLAGLATWLTVYPIDYIKTLIQSDSLMSPKHNSMFGYLK